MKKLPPLILASNSLGRKLVMDSMHLTYTIIPSTYKEEMVRKKGMSFCDLAMKLALGKAKCVAENNKNALVIGADSFSVVNGETLGKPGTVKNAIIQLQKQQGREVDFYTGLAVFDTKTGNKVVECSVTKITFRSLSIEEIKAYVKKEDVTFAAGAFRSDALGATLIEKVNGDYKTVIGLPTALLAEALKKLGYSIYDFAY